MVYFITGKNLAYNTINSTAMSSSKAGKGNEGIKICCMISNKIWPMA
jgi:hypothetical protein